MDVLLAWSFSATWRAILLGGGDIMRATVQRLTDFVVLQILENVSYGCMRIAYKCNSVAVVIPP